MATSSAPPVTDVKLGKREQPIEFEFGDFQYTPLGKFIIYRLRNNFDAKLIITGDVGTGKTSLAVALARWVRAISNDIFDRLGPWDVEQHAGLDIWNYLEAYKASQPGDALVIDELQEAADRRRSQRNENVFLSWAWMKLRVRQVVSIGVLPTTSALDKRLLELADVRIDVTQRGEAVPYYLDTMRFEPYTTYQKAFRIGPYRQIIQWPNLDGDPDYERLHDMKEETGVPGVDERDTFSQSDINEAVRKERKEFVQRALDMVNNGGINSQVELAEAFGLSEPTISKYKRESGEA